MGTNKDKIPVTILTGFLGAGKTTLLNHILRAEHGLRMAVLVNDFGEVNIDAQLVVGVEGETVSLTNGCICCTIRGDLEETVIDLIKAPEPPNYIVIEASGVSDPSAVAFTFVMSPELFAHTRIDTILAVVDTDNLLRLEDQAAVLAHQQISMADLLVLNKVDLVSAETLTLLKEMLSEQIPNMRMIETTYGRVPLELLLSVGRYTMETLQQDATLDIHVHPETAEGLNSDNGHHHEHEHDHTHHDHTLVFNTWRYRSELPFDYNALRAAIKDLPTTIYRAKGMVYLDNSRTRKRLLQVAGSRIHLTLAGEWGEHTPFTELVFIGKAGTVDASQLQSTFDACLAENNLPAPDLHEETVAWARKVLDPQPMEPYSESV